MNKMQFGSQEVEGRCIGMRVALKGASDGPGYDHILSVGMPGKASSFQNLESDVAMTGTMKK